jgi:hypothetical protein
MYAHDGQFSNNGFITIDDAAGGLLSTICEAAPLGALPDGKPLT